MFPFPHALEFKAAVSTTVVSWAGVVLAPLAQVIVGKDTLIPVGIAIGLALAGIGAAWRVGQYVQSASAKLDRIPEDLGPRLQHMEDSIDRIPQDTDARLRAVRRALRAADLDTAELDEWDQ